MHARTIAIIQARMGSSRLPGKVLLDIAGQPMLRRVVERARRAKSLDGVAVATTTDPSDDAVAALCIERGYPYYRGSLHDVLDRYYQAARALNAEIIVRLTADCPLIDSSVIDETVNAFLGNTSVESGMADNQPSIAMHNPQFPYDFAANRLPPPWHRTYPIGLDVEVCAFQALERAWKETTKSHHREHVMPYLYEDEGRFRVLQVNHDPDYGTLRWTVDTSDDLELVRQIYAHFPGRDDFTWLEVLALFEREPELAQINARVQHKSLTDVDERRAS
jgi:spore coat polysaccharide biosynthesis protein SpsF